MKKGNALRRIQWQVRECPCEHLRQRAPDSIIRAQYIIIDEGHRMKNAHCKFSQVRACGLHGAAVAWQALSGGSCAGSRHAIHLASSPPADRNTSAGIPRGLSL